MSVSLGSAHAVVTLDTSQLSKGVTAAAADFARLEGSTKGISSSLSDVAGHFALIGGAISVGIGGALKTFGDFESQMNQLGVVSEATTAQMGDLGKLAKQIGKDTTFGATEAAAGLVELSKAGVKTEDILTGAGEAAATLAQAGGQDLATAAKTMSNAMNLFSLSGKDAAHIADVFANAANKSAADVDDLAQALAQVGTVANLAGLSLEDTTAALAMFADAGLKGSDAGTSLKTALTAMISPSSQALATMKDLGITFSDAKGQFVGLAGAAATLQAALGPLTEAQRNAALAAIFGSDAIRVGAILFKEGAAGVEEYTTAVEQTGTAQDVAAANMAGFNGAMEQLQGSLENVAIAFGGAVAPSIEKVAGVVAAAADQFAALPTIMQQIAGGAAAAVGGLALMAAALGKIVGLAIESAANIGKLVSAIQNSQRAMTALNAATSPVALGFAAVVLVTLRLIQLHHEHAQAAKELQGALTSLAEAANELAKGGLTEAAAATEAFNTNFAKTIDALGEEQKRLQGLADEQQAFADAMGLGTQAGLAAADAQHKLADEADRAGKAQEALRQNGETIARMLADQSLDTVRLATDIGHLVDALRNGALSGPEFAAAIEDLRLHTARYTKDTKEATAASIEDAKAKERQAAAAKGLLTQEDALAAAEEGRRRQAEQTAQAIEDSNQRQLDAIKAQQDAAKQARDDAEAAARQSEIDQANRTRQAIDDSHQRQLDAIEEERRAKKAATEAAQRDSEQALSDALGRAKQAEDDQAAARVKALEDSQAAQRAYAKSVDDTTKATLRQLKGIEDQSDALDGVQTGYRRAGESAADMLLRMDRLGRIDLSPAEEEALHLANALGKVEAKTADLNAEIANNQQDVQTWEGNIKLVTDVLGGNTDQLNTWIEQLQNGTITQDEFNAKVADPSFITHMEKLEALYESGAISHKKYNEAKKAGLFLLQRSAGGIQDENAALVDNVILLADYVAQHDDADGAVNKLTKDQKEFIAAMQSSAGATALQELQVLAYLAAIGRIPDKTVSKFIVDASASDPVVAALFEDLGLMKDGVVIPIDADDEASKTIDDVDTKLQALDKPKTVKIDLDFSAKGDGSELLKGGQTGLAAFERTIPIKAKLDAPDTSAVDKATVKDKTVPTKLEAPDTSAVDAYKPASIAIPTHLTTPLTDPVDNYKPDSIAIPTHLEAPTNSPFGEGVGTIATFDIPTELLAPDDAKVTAYEPPTIAIPTALTSPGEASVGAQATVHIPTKLDVPDISAVTQETPPTVTVPTQYGTPTWPTGMVVKGPDPLTIPTVYGAPDTTALETFDTSTFSASLDADDTDATNSLNALVNDLDTYEQDTFATGLDADDTDATTTLNDLVKALETYEQDTFTTTLDAQDNASSVVSTIQTAVNALAKTYTVTITADTSAATTAIQDLGDRLPSSPAKKGPLSKEPSFDYVTDAFIASMKEMAAMMDDAHFALTPQVTTSLRGADAVAARQVAGMGLAAATGAGAYVDARQIFLLKPTEYQRLLENASMGGAAFEWIARRDQAYATVGA